MASFLRAAVGPFTILIDAEMVLEIRPHDGKAAMDEAAGFRGWRGQSLPVVNGRLLFDLPASNMNDIAIVLRSTGEEPCYFDVETVATVQRLDEGRFRPLPPLPERVGQLFDMIFWDEASCGGAYRLRRDADLSRLVAEATIRP